MKLLLLLSFTLLSFNSNLYSQVFIYNPSPDHPYGLPHPDAPAHIKDYSEMIGSRSCKSVSRISQTEWADTVSMIWEFSYIMNGTVVQDLTYKEDGTHSGSIRQYNSDSSRWNVHYFTTATPVATLPAWTGTREENKIILYKDQTAPNGTPGYMRLSFYDISNEGYNWVGEWTDKSESFSYPTWKIFCTKTED